MKLTRANASIACVRGIQTPLNSPYSIVIACSSTAIGKMSGLTNVGIWSRSARSDESPTSRATAIGSIACDSRNTARTSCPDPTSNQNEPTIRFQRGWRAVIFSSRSRIVRSFEMAMLIESPVA